MKIEIVYKNKDLEIVGIEEFSLNEYCHLLGQKTLSLLYQIEDMNKGIVEYMDIKKYIFNLAGSIQRLPENLIDEEIKETKVKKPEDKSFFDFLLRRSE
jgi:hypothetical protein